MTVHARPAEKEQIVVPLKPLAKAVHPAPPASAPPHVCTADLGDGACIEFAQSRRTGNIELTVKSPRIPEDVGDPSLRQSTPVPVVKAMPKKIDVPRAPHAGMPTATGDFCEDLQALDNGAPMTPQNAVLEDLMTTGGEAVPSAGKRARLSVFRGSADVGLAQIIEAWPRLSVKTRTAMLALVGHVGEGKRASVAGRRRSRKAASPRP